jgi:hypothetical protein
MNVDEYAHAIGVSPRRVRALIKQGQIRAQKVGRGWEISELAKRRQARRPLSEQSQKALGIALSQRSLDGLSGQLRARTAHRIRTLRASAKPSVLIADWWGGKEPAVVHNVITSWVARAVRGDNEYLLERLHTRPPAYLRSRKNLAAIVSSERAILGLSRTQLAELANVDSNLIAEIENAKPVSSVGAVRSVLRAINIQPSALPNIEVS